MNLGPYERNCRAHWAGARRPDARGFLVPAVPRRSRPAGALPQRRHGARADPRHRRPVEGHQRPDPLCAGRQSADRPDAGRAERLRGLRLHLRHRAGRRRRQGAGRMGDRGRRPNGTCGPATRAASPPLPPTRTIASPRAWRSTATNTRSISRTTPGRPGATRSCRRSTTASRRSAAQFNAYNGWERATWYARTGRRHLGGRRRRPSRAPGRGSSASARNAWRCATPPAFSTCRASRASAWRARAPPTGSPSRSPALVPKVGRIGLAYFADDERPHRHRDVDRAPSTRIC